MEEKREKSFRTLYWLFAVVFVVWVAFQLIPYLSFKSWPDRGVFGDSFGAVNSLFSGFAFAGIIYTIILQSKELQLQRLELTLTRKELLRSALAQEEAEKSLKEQARLMQEQAKLMAEQSKYMAKQTIALEEAAKLDAISTIVTFYSQSAAGAQKDNYKWFVDATKKASHYIAKLEKQIEEINKNDNG